MYYKDGKKILWRHQDIEKLTTHKKIINDLEK